MLLKPQFLVLDYLIDHYFIRDRLIFLLSKISDIVSEQVVRNDESLLTFLALISCIEEAVGVVVILRWGATKDSLLLK